MRQGRWIFAISLTCHRRRRIALAAGGPCLFPQRPAELGECDLPPIDFVALAQAVGARGVRIDDPRTARPKFDEALATPGPVIIETVVDEYMAMLPAKITPDHAMKFSLAVAKGQPTRLIALTAAKDTVR
jgi:hypothetical protein